MCHYIIFVCSLSNIKIEEEEEDEETIIERRRKQREELLKRLGAVSEDSNPSVVSDVPAEGGKGDFGVLFPFKGLYRVYSECLYLVFYFWSKSFIVYTMNVYTPWRKIFFSRKI